MEALREVIAAMLGHPWLCTVASYISNQFVALAEPTSALTWFTRLAIPFVLLCFIIAYLRGLPTRSMNWSRLLWKFLLLFIIDDHYWKRNDPCFAIFMSLRFALFVTYVRMTWWTRFPPEVIKKEEEEEEKENAKRTEDNAPPEWVTYNMTNLSRERFSTDMRFRRFWFLTGFFTTLFIVAVSSIVYGISLVNATQQSALVIYAVAFTLSMFTFTLAFMVFFHIHWEQYTGHAFVAVAILYPLALLILWFTVSPEQLFKSLM